MLLDFLLSSLLIISIISALVIGERNIEEEEGLLRNCLESCGWIVVYLDLLSLSATLTSNIILGVERPLLSYGPLDKKITN